MKIFLFLIILYFISFFKTHDNYCQDDITLITALFKIETNRYNFTNYLDWVNNLLSINRSIVFFIDKNISQLIKNKRPKIFVNKTIWIENDFKDLYSYKHFKKEFNETYLIDGAKYKHTVPLFILWAEKCFFIKKTIYYNYFRSKCFYWIDAGYFREKNMSSFINNWPSTEKCYSDPRVLINGVREIGSNEFKLLKSFDYIAHEKFKNNCNVGAGLFGGQAKYLIRFIYYYYKTIKLFYKKKKFIGSEQNLYTYINYLHKDIVNLINTKMNYYYFKTYLSKND